MVPPPRPTIVSGGDTMTTQLREPVTENPILTDDERWEIVQRRDPGYDGTFLYAVRSTGVYCRPSCPSRRPRREQVRFFSRAAEAERAGFRACRRCRPNEAVPATLAERARAWIDAHPDETFTLESLGSELRASPSYLQRSFKTALGVSPREYAESRRFAAARERLRAGDDVTRALYDAGYGSSSRFYEQAREQLGMAPGAYRRGGKGVTIAYTIVDCPLGRLLVAATERGLCAVSLGSSDAPLEAFLRDEFPAADLRRDDQRLADVVAALLAH